MPNLYMPPMGLDAAICRDRPSGRSANSYIFITDSRGRLSLHFTGMGRVGNATPGVPQGTKPAHRGPVLLRSADIKRSLRTVIRCRSVGRGLAPAVPSSVSLRTSPQTGVAISWWNFQILLNFRYRNGIIPMRHKVHIFFKECAFLIL